MILIRHAELRTKAQRRAWPAVENKIHQIWRHESVMISIDKFEYIGQAWRASGRIEGDDTLRPIYEGDYVTRNADGSYAFSIKTASRALAAWLAMKEE